MSEPTIAAKEPAVIELEPGTYYWCACGKSANQPFCDGSHEGTGFVPHELEITQKQTVALCQCKHTKKPPFCDGSHVDM
ncbi:MAG: CDGSH iron-sulfur domain-containing protein [Mariprofundaceae bacterium]|nr:CDGSH iron-sulfur domain-containing protein [Mariprofundaceae bacterium]